MFSPLVDSPPYPPSWPAQSWKRCEMSVSHWLIRGCFLRQALRVIIVLMSKTWGEQQVSLKHTSLRHACPLFSCLLFLYSLESFILWVSPHQIPIPNTCITHSQPCSLTNHIQEVIYPLTCCTVLGFYMSIVSEKVITNTDITRGRKLWLIFEVWKGYRALAVNLTWEFWMVCYGMFKLQCRRNNYETCWINRWTSKFSQWER